VLRASAYLTPSEASSRRRCGHASRFLQQSGFECKHAAPSTLRRCSAPSLAASTRTCPFTSLSRTSPSTRPWRSSSQQSRGKRQAVEGRKPLSLYIYIYVYTYIHVNLRFPRGHVHRRGHSETHRCRVVESGQQWKVGNHSLSLSLYIYIYIYIYIHIHTYLFTRMPIHLIAAESWRAASSGRYEAYMYTHTYPHKHARAYVCVHVYVCV